MPVRAGIAHKYKVGQTVGFLPSRWSMRARGETCTVVQLLPSDYGESLYRVKCAGEAFERMAREGELSEVAAEPIEPPVVPKLKARR